MRAILLILALLLLNPASSFARNPDAKDVNVDGSQFSKNIPSSVTTVQGAFNAVDQANIKGDKGDTGAAGPGVATGGTSGQVLTKNSNTNYDTIWAPVSSGLSGLTPGKVIKAGTSSTGIDSAIYSSPAGKVGIGTLTPVGSLQVVGSTILSGNVGIGTLTPNVSLYVNGAIQMARSPDGCGAASYARGVNGSFDATGCSNTGLETGVIYDWAGGNVLATVDGGLINCVSKCTGTPASCDYWNADETSCLKYGCSGSYFDCSGIGDQPTCEGTSGCSDVFNGNCDQLMYPDCTGQGGCYDAYNQDCAGLSYPQCTELSGCNDSGGGSCYGTTGYYCMGYYWTGCLGSPFSSCGGSPNSCQSIHNASDCSSDLCYYGGC